MLTWFAQELFSSCVAACVRMALNGLGDSRDEAQVRQLIGHVRPGVSLAAAQARLAEAGATAEWHDDWNLSDRLMAPRPVGTASRPSLKPGSWQAAKPC